MSLKGGPEIRMDDVLQIPNSITAHQMNDLGDRKLFDAFLDADDVFKKYGYPCTLAILADGIDFYPAWTWYIQENLYRYNIELHGMHHINYRNVPYKKFMEDTREAIDKIEKTFDTKVTTWYPPWGRKGERMTQAPIIIFL